MRSLLLISIFNLLLGPLAQAAIEFQVGDGIQFENRVLVIERIIDGYATLIDPAHYEYTAQVPIEFLYNYLSDKQPHFYRSVTSNFAPRYNKAQTPKNLVSNDPGLILNLKTGGTIVKIDQRFRTLKTAQLEQVPRVVRTTQGARLPLNQNWPDEIDLFDLERAILDGEYFYIPPPGSKGLLPFRSWVDANSPNELEAIEVDGVILEKDGVIRFKLDDIYSIFMIKSITRDGLINDRGMLAPLSTTVAFLKSHSRQYTPPDKSLFSPQPNNNLLDIFNLRGVFQSGHATPAATPNISLPPINRRTPRTPRRPDSKCASFKIHLLPGRAPIVAIATSEYVVIARPTTAMDNTTSEGALKPVQILDNRYVLIYSVFPQIADGRGNSIFSLPLTTEVLHAEVFQNFLTVRLPNGEAISTNLDQILPAHDSPSGPGLSCNVFPKKDNEPDTP